MILPVFAQFHTNVDAMGSAKKKLKKNIKGIAPWWMGNIANSENCLPKTEIEEKKIYNFLYLFSHWVQNSHSVER